MSIGDLIKQLPPDQEEMLSEAIQDYHEKLLSQAPVSKEKFDTWEALLVSLGIKTS